MLLLFCIVLILIRIDICTASRLGHFGFSSVLNSIALGLNPWSFHSIYPQVMIASWVLAFSGSGIMGKLFGLGFCISQVGILGY